MQTIIKTNTEFFQLKNRVRRNLHIKTSKFQLCFYYSLLCIFNVHNMIYKLGIYRIMAKPVIKYKLALCLYKNGMLYK